LESAVSGSDSYPSISILVLTLLASLVPVSLELLTGSRLVRRLTTGVLGVAVVAVAATQVYAGLHWPLDVGGAGVIGLTLAQVARLTLDAERWHRRCRGCLWQAAELGERPPHPVEPGWRGEVPTGRMPVGEVTPGSARTLHRVSLAWTGGLLVFFSVAAWVRGVPRTAESGVSGPVLEWPVHAALLTIIVVGVLLARRWHATGAVIVAVAAALFGYAASVEYPAWIAVLVAGAAYVPALLLWIEWHRRMTLRAIIGVSIVTSVVLSTVVGAAAQTYSYYWGPTHPASATPAPDRTVVDWMWAGGVTPSAVTVRARTTTDAEARLIVSPNATSQKAFRRRRHEPSKRPTTAPCRLPWTG
jgi:hypothetical protein